MSEQRSSTKGAGIVVLVVLALITVAILIQLQSRKKEPPVRDSHQEKSENTPTEESGSSEQGRSLSSGDDHQQPENPAEKQAQTQSNEQEEKFNEVTKRLDDMQAKVTELENQNKELQKKNEALKEENAVPLNIRIRDVQVEEAYEGSDSGMRFRIFYDISGLRNVVCVAGVYFFYPDGRKLSANNPHYRAKTFDTGTVATAEAFVLKSNSEIGSTEVFIPYDAIGTESGNYYLSYRLRIAKREGSQSLRPLYESALLPIHFTR